jgi:hypothetical protein
LGEGRNKKPKSKNQRNKKATSQEYSKSNFNIQGECGTVSALSL